MESATLALSACPPRVAAVTRLQAAFRGKRYRELHVDRVHKGLPWSPFVPAKMEAVRTILQQACLQPGETLLDIGSGDGRVVISAAAMYPALRATIGVEIDPALVNESRHKIQISGVADRVQIIQGDWMEMDMQSVDVVTLFFLPHDDIARLLSEKLRSGTRVITYVFRIEQWEPEEVTMTVPFMTTTGSSPIYTYRVPQKE